MKTTAQRLLIFFIGVPLVVVLVVLLPQKNHLTVNILSTLVSALGAVEFSDLLRKKDISIPSVEAALLGALCPLSMTLTVSFGVPDSIILGALTLGAFWLLISRVFDREDTFRDFTGRVAAGFAVMIYPGLFLAWFIRMALLPHADMVMLMFLIIVIANDSVAWAAGMIFGTGNRGIIFASPNKSIAGFVGGFTASLLTGIGAVLLIPGAFTSPRFPSLPAGAILGVLSAAAGSLGDLGESVLKRSSQVKDSGTLIPGRGGILDSVDSIALSAPVYYLSFWFLFI
ncbi:MAG: phosphatidate cytidylyltransferase [Treponema sp.]|jgi:phosphatidate cytidylyltransferase|nr:phosphatidate cytidylyltransferase [Treponema sp.]